MAKMRVSPQLHRAQLTACRPRVRLSETFVRLTAPETLHVSGPSALGKLSRASGQSAIVGRGMKSAISSAVLSDSSTVQLHRYADVVGEEETIGFLPPCPDAPSKTDSYHLLTNRT